jgi:ATP-dependent helicase Lhr and Lhr-like helicase
MTDVLRAGVGRAFFGDFAKLRAVQAKAIPAIVSGADALVRAPTASGKTEAAIAPIVSRYLDDLRRPEPGVGVIIVSPTRALVNDLHRRLEGPLERLGIRCGVRHGERNDLRLVEPPAVLLTTPESFDIEVGREPVAFEQVRAVVLDEAHLLYNTQRGMQIAIAIQRLQTWLCSDVQVVGLSATIGSSADVWRFFRPGYEVEDVIDKNGRGIDAQLRLNVSITELAGLLGKVDDTKVLVFANSRRDCDRIADQLKRSDLKCSVFTHHSSLPREVREATENGFEAAGAAICVATSTLELGIDIGSIDLVVLFGIPADWQSLAQRVGRGNRRSTKIEALLCASSEHAQPDSISQLFGFQALILQITDPEITDARPREIFGAAGQQLASWLVANERFRGINPLVEPMKAWSHLDAETVNSILDELTEHDVLTKHPAYRQYGPARGAHELERTWDLWSNFAGAGREVDVFALGAAVGRVSARDAERLETGDCFLLGGQRWRLVSRSMFEIEVRPVKTAPNFQLRYGSAAPTQGPLHAEAIRRVLLSPVAQFCEIRPSAVREKLESTAAELAPLAADEWIPMTRDSNGRYLYLTFAGALVNTGISSAMADKTAVNGQFVLETDGPIDWTRIPTAFAELQLQSELPSSRSRTRFQEWLPDEIARREQLSADRAPYGHDVVLRRLRAAVESPTPIELIDRFRN